MDGKSSSAQQKGFRQPGGGGREGLINSASLPPL